MKKSHVLLAVGQISLAVSILINHFAKGNDFASFITGLLVGLSLVFNVAFLINQRKIKANDRKKLHGDFTK